MRAAMSQSLLAAAKRLPPRDRDRIIERAGQPALDAITSPLPVAWVSGVHHMNLASSIHGVLGPKRTIELWRGAMSDTFQRPFLRGFVRVTTGLLGVRPSSLLKHAGSVYEHVTRNLGLLRYEPTAESEGIVELVEFPVQRFDFGSYVDGMIGCIEATLTLCNARGDVLVIAQDDRRGEVRWRVTWAG
jgi:hypothetical protein